MLSTEEKARYARHFTLSQVGLEGQQKLKDSSVLCIGAGGLGSPAALYLAAAGVGRIGLVDADVVELSNLQRQILHGQSTLGMSKLESATTRLSDINPHVQVEQHPVNFTAENAMEIAKDYDIILDGTDNFPTRYLSNDVSVLLKKPNIYASIFRFEGQLSVFAPHLGGPCYRCMLPQPPDPGSVPSCAEAGVLGVLPGIIGSMQAMEAIKILLDVGEPPLGRLLHYDALHTRFREFKLKRDPQCALCGDHPTITQLVNYQNFCGMPDSNQETNQPGEISVEELKQRLENGFDGTLIDVRETWEHDVANIPEAKLIPLATVPSHIPTLKELGLDAEIIIHCKAGMRSDRACEFLRGEGFSNVTNVAGGMDAWLKL
ncbi:molybdopterin-synthase adenylyltransferase MoeB [Verrucomicrobiaceae bacterium R5-34]|nr:molybdopterin-synthase adenylyltransferase MoeB [Verrucomicrobiaceae bacterium R5-34]